MVGLGGGPLGSYLIHVCIHSMLGGDHQVDLDRDRLMVIGRAWLELANRPPPIWGGSGKEPKNGQKRPKKAKMTQKKHRLYVGALHLHQEMY
jgi:hypothetical protein